LSSDESVHETFTLSFISVSCLDDRESAVRSPAGFWNFSLHHRVQNGSEAHPASYTTGTEGSFPGGKAAEPRSWWG